ncbi:hypothetical protein Glove_37g89 [Diversispora epigaea]|uniref:Uncharacterized protein n=1 Tax=Diversispora epigaea TaxID=1348612 RepID=A0A397JKI9_9GLOM|nr:hypothetical protein Glove_37g89 [Diversispora epigaea]
MSQLKHCNGEPSTEGLLLLGHLTENDSSITDIHKVSVHIKDMMNSMYKRDENPKRGPMKNKEKWQEREYELKVNY